MKKKEEKINKRKEEASRLILVSRHRAMKNKIGRHDGWHAR
jgi:hypothetical protein